MSRPKISVFAVPLGLLLLAATAILGAFLVLGSGPNAAQENWPVQFRSNGERIYFTGTSASGQVVTAAGGGMHMRMHGGSCASCHGFDRLGGRLMPRFWLVAPALTPSALFDDHGGEQSEASDEHGHGDHEMYDDATLAHAITKGLDPGDKQLDPAMPRWSMADQDLADLIAFLRSPVVR